MDPQQFAQFTSFQKTMLEKLVTQSQTPQVSIAAQGNAFNTALLPNFECFDAKKESFRNYKQRFENYLEMKNIINNKEYCTKLLLNSIGAKNFNMIAALAAPKTPSELTDEELMSLLEKHLAPKRNILVAQHQFLSKYQSSKAIALETSKIDSKELAQKASTSTPSTDINKVTRHSRKNDYQQRNRNRSQQRSSKNPTKAKGQSKSKIDYVELGIEGLCLRCGRDNHLTKDCRTDRSNLKCSGCDKSGHIIKRIVDIYQNHQPSTKEIKRYYTHVNIEGKTVEFEIDSGSGYTFLPRNVFTKLNLKTPLLPTSIGFRSYTQNVFTPDGKIRVNVNYKGKSIQEEIYIVPEGYTALLGRIWIRRLKIDLNEIDRQHSTTSSILAINTNEIEEITTKYPDVFEEKIGCVPKFKVSLKLRSNTTPVFNREREIPYALQSRVENELNTLESTGIITKTETSDWGSPLVVIPKADGGVRLCVDYKIGVNDRLINAHYPIRKIDDILNSLRSSRYFCWLDLFKAYLHIPVDDQSSEIQTISTHRGTY
ncbi:PREDICTED: uncharacterized protein K02A2.6-like, partial [Vollenhovia emeryi]|uniref:uncharacterized protein K02A2.6-like n=1 Tax=Vollenhovia emeryi TaxID=411798 RepID=UPI0005F49418